MMLMRRLVVLLLAGFVVLAHAEQTAGVEAQKIEYLIAAVETLQGAQFVRNGVTYDGKSAADHLRLKWHMAGSKVATAEDFIHYCASASSVTKLPYTIRFSDGHTLTSEAYLRQKLSEYPPEPQAH